MHPHEPTDRYVVKTFQSITAITVFGLGKLLNLSVPRPPSREVGLMVEPTLTGLGSGYTG